MIELRNITKSYDGLEVLRGINLDISRSEIVAITGPSGAGKTTLLQIMGSLDRPDTGSVAFGGTSILELSDKRLAQFRNRNIGFVFQFHQLLPEFTLEENVMLPALIGGMSRRQAMARAGELIGYLGLTERASHRPSELSGGERQRVAVARALADEPSGSLDSANRTELHRLFFDLRRDFGHTFVIVTHDETLAADADRIVHMRDGLITDIAIRKEIRR